MGVQTRFLSLIILGLIAMQSLSPVMAANSMDQRLIYYMTNTMSQEEIDSRISKLKEQEKAKKLLLDRKHNGGEGLGEFTRIEQSLLDIKTEILCLMNK